MQDNLAKVGQALAANPSIILDKVTLAYDQAVSDTVEDFNFDHNNLGVSLGNFLSQCGQRINVLNIECSKNIRWTLNDLSLISQYCPFLDILEISKFKEKEVEDGGAAAFGLPPLNFRFMTGLRLKEIQVESLTRETLLYILSGCPDLEELR